MDKELKHLKFIAACERVGIQGGRKRTYFEVCERAANRGNERAAELLREFYPEEI